MKDKNFLYSLIPLLLLIVLPWLFGRLGSKAKEGIKKRMDNLSQSFPGRTGEEGYSEAEEDWLLLEESEVDPYEDTELSYGDHQKMTGFRDIPAPTISPEPIKPRWWA